jgi:hypothetical protein
MLWNLHIYIYLSLYYYIFQRFDTKYDHADFTVFIYEHYIGCIFFLPPLLDRKAPANAPLTLLRTPPVGEV